MSPYQNRVVAEKKELDAKIDKLGVFINSGKMQGVSGQERLLLNRQASDMANYSATLGKRISFFRTT